MPHAFVVGWRRRIATDLSKPLSNVGLRKRSHGFIIWPIATCMLTQPRRATQRMVRPDRILGLLARGSDLRLRAGEGKRCPVERVREAAFLRIRQRDGLKQRSRGTWRYPSSGRVRQVCLEEIRLFVVGRIAQPNLSFPQRIRGREA